MVLVRADNLNVGVRKAHRHAEEAIRLGSNVETDVAPCACPEMAGEHYHIDVTAEISNKNPKPRSRSRAKKAKDEEA